MMNEVRINSKIAEKLKIMKKRIKCVLIQIHYMKNTLLGENSFFTKLCADTNVDQAIKLLNRKFPNVDIRTNSSILEPLTSKKTLILDQLQFHYSTLTDVLEVKDNVIDILGEISALQLILDIKKNTQLTELYLDLVVNYARIMISLSNIPQIRLILAIYNLAFSSNFNQNELVYHRLCERLVEKHKDTCMGELYNELYPYSKVLMTALSSVSELLAIKLATSNEWEEAQAFKLMNGSDTALKPLSNILTLIPLMKIQRWLIIGYLVVYSEIPRSPTITLTFRAVLDSAVCIVIFRDDLLPLHPFLIKFFASNQKVLLKLVKDSQRDVATREAVFHRTRRNYLRLVMRHQLQVLVDQPGILGPNSLTLSHTLAFATDEIHCFLTNAEMSRVKKSTGKGNIDEWNDPQMPEFLFVIEEIRHLLQQFEIVAEYHRKVLTKQCSLSINRIISTISTEEHIQILTSFINTINFPDTKIDKPYKGLRLDWLRLQSFLSLPDEQFDSSISELLNTVVIHTNFIDNLPKFLDKFSSLKLLFFHQSTFQSMFDGNLKCPAQHRYIIVFPRLCNHFLNNCVVDCPEDFNKVLCESTQLTHTSLSCICQELCKLMAAVIQSQFQSSLQNQAVNAVDLYHRHLNKKQKDGNEVSDVLNERGSLCDDLSFDCEINALSQLAASLHSRPLLINNRTFYPSYYLRKEIILFLNNKLVSLANVKFKRDKHEATIGVRKPSEMKMLIAECLNVITRISEYVNINVSMVFLDVFLNQSLSKDYAGQMTLTEIYSKWYINFILTQPHILHSPLLKSFVTIFPPSQKEAATIILRTEEYTDIVELQTLAEIIGPFGMLNLDEEIMRIIINKVGILRSFVQQHRSTLIELNVLNLDSVKVKKLMNDMGDVDEFCQTCREMGVLLAFKDLCREAVQEVTMRSVPFLRATVADLQLDLHTEQNNHLSEMSENGNTADDSLTNRLIVSELCQGFGLKTKVDSALFAALQNKKIEQQKFQSVLKDTESQKNDLQNELLMVAISYFLPKLIGSNFYRIEYEALDNNAHCSAYTIRELMYAFFGHHSEEILNMEIRKFIGLTSFNLLRLGCESDLQSPSSKEETAIINNRNSIYLFFDYVIKIMEDVPENFYEECFPYALVRQAYHDIVKQSRQVFTNAAHPSDASSKAALEALKVGVK